VFRDGQHLFGKIRHHDLAFGTFDGGAESRLAGSRGDVEDV